MMLPHLLKGFRVQIANHGFMANQKREIAGSLWSPKACLMLFRQQMMLPHLLRGLYINAGCISNWMPESDCHR